MACWSTLSGAQAGSSTGNPTQAEYIELRREIKSILQQLDSSEVEAHAGRFGVYQEVSSTSWWVLKNQKRHNLRKESLAALGSESPTTDPSGSGRVAKEEWHCNTEGNPEKDASLAIGGAESSTAASDKSARKADYDGISRNMSSTHDGRTKLEALPSETARGRVNSAQTITGYRRTQVNVFSVANMIANLSLKQKLPTSDLHYNVAPLSCFRPEAQRWKSC